jgi:hypothetical protein
MSTLSTIHFGSFDSALRLLNAELFRLAAPRYQLVICGGSALFAARLVERVTKDVDILALRNEKKQLIDPEPMPEPLLQAARMVAQNLALQNDWLNNGPSKGDGGIFRLGLPPGLSSRLTELPVGKKLTLYVISRLDQIHLKLYAAVDQSGGYHADDLYSLKPSADELRQAALWSFSHDPSAGYRQSLIHFLKEFGYEEVAAGI